MDNWKPAAHFDEMRLRAQVLSSIRVFFDDRDVLEVETPLLCSTTASDPYLTSMSCRVNYPGGNAQQRLFLQTSPELPMKRLLAAGSGAIYQISKAFRDGEAGRLHNPEFTLLEWYRPDFDHHRLMDEMDDLLNLVLGSGPADRCTYDEAFRRHAGVAVLDAPTHEIRDAAKQRITAVPDLPADDRNAWLDLLLTHLVEPELGRDRPTFIYDYPADQAALARISPNDDRVAERFEVWVDGIELANGYHELADAGEQRRRIESDNRRRSELRFEPVPIDEQFLDALEHGLPDCAGVALGIDRLVMLAAGKSNINDVIAFPIDRA